MTRPAIVAIDNMTDFLSRLNSQLVEAGVVRADSSGEYVYLPITTFLPSKDQTIEYCLRKIEELQDQYDIKLMLVDIALVEFDENPNDQSGVEVARLVRSRFKSVPVVGVTRFMTNGRFFAEAVLSGAFVTVLPKSFFEAKGLSRREFELLMSFAERGNATSGGARGSGVSFGREVFQLVPEKREISRKTSAILFLDIKDYSKLTDVKLVTYFGRVLPELVEVINRHEPTYVNSWGDAFVVVFDEPLTAAECGLALCDYFKRKGWAQLDLPELGARVAAHFGPVYFGSDPVRNTIGVVESQVSLAARVEPVTQVGEVWVTDTFESVLRRYGADHIACDALGEHALAKGWGAERLFRLRLARGETTKAK